MELTAPMEEIGRILDELEGRADVIIGSVHYSLDGEYGAAGMREVAEAYGGRMDALFIGHAHAKVDETIGGIPVLEPGTNGESVSKVTLTLKADGDGWTVASAEGSSSTAPPPLPIPAS